MELHQQPLIRMLFLGLFMLLGLLAALPLLAQDGLLHSGWEYFTPWSRPQKAPLYLADGSTPSLRPEAPWMLRVLRLAVRTSSIPMENLVGGEDVLFHDGSQEKSPLFLVADTSPASPSSQNPSAIGSGGMSVILSAPTNSPSSSLPPSYQSSPSSPFHSNSPPAAQPAIVIEPAMPGFENRGIETYVPNALPPPPGGTILEGGWLSDQTRTFLLRNLLVFFGVHGFKGPTDLGHSGNFGFHEGVNWGAPLWEPWGWGFQLGMEALHSNFLGTQAVDVGFGPPLQMADRNQIFFTGGVFQRRMEQGMQGGLAVDLFYDHYYADTTLCQLRSETSIVFSPYHEVGYWGAYAVSRTTLRGVGADDAMIRPNDLFALFYRRRFTGGGMGRIWTGLSTYGDLVLGLEGTVPLGTQWAIDNNFTCLFPKHGRRAGDRPEECWSVSIHLVWYPGRQSNPVVSNPYHPLFYVADNSWFLVKRRP